MIAVQFKNEAAMPQRSIEGLVLHVIVKSAGLGLNATILEMKCGMQNNNFFACLGTRIEGTEKYPTFWIYR